MANDQREYVMGIMQGISQYERQEMKDKVRPENLLETQRKNIQGEIDKLKVELKTLEKIRKKREYS